MSSSWTWIDIFDRIFCVFISFEMLIIAILITSTAVPWMGMFTETRSAAARCPGCPALISGR